MDLMTEIYLLFSKITVIEATVISIFIGLSIGSFSNVVIHRLPIMMKREWKQICEEEVGIEPSNLENYNLSTPRSNCPKCHSLIKWYRNIPILSWILLRGKCKECKTKIPITYPLIEFIITLITSFSIYTLWPNPLSVILPITIILSVILLMIDMKHMLLPDSITFTIMWLGLSSSALGLIPLIPEFSILGVLFTYIFFIFMNKIMLLWKKVEGMGHGDIKYMAAMGAWFGPEKMIFIVFFICLIAIILFILADLISKSNLISKESDFYKEYEKTTDETKKNLGFEQVEEYKYKRIMPLGPSISLVFMFTILIEYIL